MVVVCVNGSGYQYHMSNRQIDLKTKVERSGLGIFEFVLKVSQPIWECLLT